ncbi:RNA methyltransferase, TrmH family [Faunimonas pinastri]|uniref:RNA methyltransferase, TrmH family n=1 Tax=Faunimonas pinastri TaxID=1855383 RepID=A0A1H9HL27_9HYPH|nr:RNA methyltransferase [Faunimonas pinastri]SEQ63049.1 RNA methyltransferase, TrmH family [Faunimonas pinastri]
MTDDRHDGLPDGHRHHPDRPRQGSFKRVTSLTNPLVKDIRNLQQKKFRDEKSLFIAEGQKLVRDAMDGDWPIETLVYGDELAGDEAIGQLAARAKTAGATVMEVSALVLEKIARRDNPQTVIGIFRQHFAPASSVGEGGLWVALDRVRDPGNLGTILRTADAAGVAGVALVGHCCDPFASETVRATMGSIFHVPMAKISEEAFLSHVRRRKLHLVGTHLSAKTMDYRAARYDAPTLLLMGNEQQGLTVDLADACDELVKIPMRGRADSLNLAVSTGLMIYEALRTTLR